MGREGNKEWFSVKGFIFIVTVREGEVGLGKKTQANVTKPGKRSCYGKNPYSITMFGP